MLNSSIVISPLVLFCFQGRLIKQFGELITFFLPIQEPPRSGTFCDFTENSLHRPPGTATNLFHNAFETIIRPQSAPVFIREVHIRQCFYTGFYKTCDPFQLHGSELFSNQYGFLSSGLFIILGMNCFQDGDNLPDMFPRTYMVKAFR